MIDHDRLVGDLLALLDELGIADDTIVVYSTDNGPHMNTWPDGGMTPFRGEKNSNWEGAYRVPAVVRWPGRIPAGHRAQRHRQPRRLVPDPARRRRGARHRRLTWRAASTSTARGTTCTSTASTSSTTSPERRRRARASTSSTCPTTAISRRCGSTTGSWSSSSNARRARSGCGPSRSRELRVPKIFNLRTDPFERADITSNTYYDWILDHAWVAVPMQAFVVQMIQTLRRVPAPAEAGELQPRAGAREAADRSATARDGVSHLGRARRRARDDMVWVPGGTFRDGIRRPLPRGGAGPRVEVGAFWIGAHAVTNAEFAAFVDATGYRTVAERPLDPADFPGRPGGEPACPGRWSSCGTPGPVDLRHLSQWWRVDARRLLAAPGGTAQRSSTAARTTRSCTSPTRTPRRTPPGPG